MLMMKPIRPVAALLPLPPLFEPHGGGGRPSSSSPRRPKSQQRAAGLSPRWTRSSGRGSTTAARDTARLAPTWVPRSRPVSKSGGERPRPRAGVGGGRGGEGRPPPSLLKTRRFRGQPPTPEIDTLIKPTTHSAMADEAPHGGDQEDYGEVDRWRATPSSASARTTSTRRPRKQQAPRRRLPLPPPLQPCRRRRPSSSTLSQQRPS